MDEGVKLGAWVRSGSVVGRVVEFDERRGLAGAYLLDVLGGGSIYCPAGAAEPWVPRVGEWVQHRSGARFPVQGVREPTPHINGEVIAPGGASAPFGDVTPCAAPASACTTAKGTSAAIAPIPQGPKIVEAGLALDAAIRLAILGPETAGSFAAAAVHDAVLRDHLYGESTAARKPVAESKVVCASGLIGGQRVDYLIVDDPHKSAAPRDHNATCSRCGGRAYQGIGAVRCVETVCDDPKMRMPESVVRVVRVPNRPLNKAALGKRDAARPTLYAEARFRASGRGVTVDHPTDEGAVLAWREAVAK